MRRLWQPAAAAVGLLSATLVTGEAFTPIHKAGRCAIRGACGSGGFFSPKLPCPDNGLAEEPEEEVRTQLVELCGAKWSSGPVCCSGEQVKYTHSSRITGARADDVLYRSRRYPKTSRRLMRLSPPARLAKITSITYSVHLRVLRTSRSLSTSRRRRKVVRNIRSRSWISSYRMNMGAAFTIVVRM